MFPPRERATDNIPANGINLYKTHNSSAGAPIRAPAAGRRVSMVVEPFELVW